jgi:hypothetical protein
MPEASIVLKATDKSFVLMTDKLGAFCLSGESHRNARSAAKSMRLVACCGPSLSHDGFNLRIYCVNDLYVALQVWSITTSTNRLVSLPFLPGNKNQILYMNQVKNENLNK